MSDGFRFDAPRNLAVYVCEHVGRGTRPIRLVAHDADGDWQFLCDQDDDVIERAMLVCLGEVVDRDPSVNELATMHRHHRATRDAPGRAWTIVDETEERVRRNIPQCRDRRC